VVYLSSLGDILWCDVDNTSQNQSLCYGAGLAAADKINELEQSESFVRIVEDKPIKNYLALLLDTIMKREQASSSLELLFWDAAEEKEQPLPFVRILEGELIKNYLELVFRYTIKIRISKKVQTIIDELISENERFRDVNTEGIVENLSKILEEFLHEQIDIPEEEIYDRIRKILALRSISGMLNDLTSDERKKFDERVKGLHL